MHIYVVCVLLALSPQQISSAVGFYAGKLLHVLSWWHKVNIKNESPLFSESFNFILFLHILISENACNCKKEYYVLFLSKHTDNSSLLNALVLFLSPLTVMYIKLYKTYELSACFISAVIDRWLLHYILMYPP